MFRRGDCSTYFWERQSKGVRYKEPLGASRDHAHKRAVELNDALARGDLPEVLRRPDKRPLASFLKDVLADRTASEDLRPKTIAAFENRLRLLCHYLEEEHPDIVSVHQLTPGIAAGYVGWRRRQRVARSGRATSDSKLHPPASQTVYDDVRKLRTLFNHAVQRDMIDVNPFAKVRPSIKAHELRTLDRPLSDSDVQRLLAAAKRYDEAPQCPNAPSVVRGMMHEMIAFYLLTGLRKEELIYLPWKHVDRGWGEYGRVRIEPVDVKVQFRLDIAETYAQRLDALAEGRAGRKRLFVNTASIRRHLPPPIRQAHAEGLPQIPPRAWKPKSRRLIVYTRVTWRQKAMRGFVPLQARSRAIIDERWSKRRKRATFVFPHPDGGPLKTDPLPQFKKVVEDAGLPSTVRLHDLRHTFAFTLRDQDVPIESIKGLMRHRDIEETMIYAPYRLEEGARRVQDLGANWRL